ncbi:MAG TPA: hypothetical protein VMT55_04070, partial [Candidatus Sulfotelmatobacter sp.]|nr:hypothetical protein [Candidatus Sulfotelmatobacter sp.]
FVDTHRNSNNTVPNPIRGNGTVATTYLGVKLRPFIPGDSPAAKLANDWFLGKRLTLDLKVKLASVAAESNPTLPLNFRRPDLAGSLVDWHQWYTAAVSVDWDWHDPSLRTLYGNFLFNLGGTRQPFAQAQIGPVCNMYTFKNLGKDRERRSCGVGVNYTLDLANLNSSLFGYNFADVNLNFVVPIWEFERERASGYMTHDNEADRFIFGSKGGGGWLGPVPWQGRVTLDLNFGKYGLLQGYAGGSYQLTDQFKYYNWTLGGSYQYSY